MADRAEVPPHPLVTIEVDERGLLTINGHPVPSDGAADPWRLATDIVRTDFARPLGRPVRAVATVPGQHVRILVHPDGRVTDVRATQAGSPVGVPPATRAQVRLGTREAERVAVDGATAGHRAQRLRPAPRLAAAVALTAAVTLAGVWHQRGATPEEPAAADRPWRMIVAEAAPPQQVVEAARLLPVAVSDVRADAAPGIIEITVEARRRTQARVVLTSLDAATATRRLTLSIRGATRRVVVLTDLVAGRYRWQVLVPGQAPNAGRIDVPPFVPEPVEVVTVPAEVPPPTPAGEGRRPTDEDGADDDRGGDDPPRPVGLESGPDRPYDPDDH